MSAPELSFYSLTPASLVFMVHFLFSPVSFINDLDQYYFQSSPHVTFYSIVIYSNIVTRTNLFKKAAAASRLGSGSGWNKY